MNKNRYRIIYNKARHMFMAVAENAKSQTKTSGQSTSTVTETTDQAFHQLWHVKALVVSMSLWMPLSTVYAGMVADPGANAANRPVIGVGQNTQKQNVPVINIQTPNAGGVSHNIYKEFDVPTQGAVLNNSRAGAASSIVGSVGANPYLQKGEARVILNEVNSAIASKFEGNLEIAGQRADLIIANPAGINIKGGGFINANKAILTTGKPQFNADGSIKEFIVDQGKITISANAGSNLGLGGTANNNANYVDIYTRALELNAQVHANNDIQAITGANIISADLAKVEAKTSTAAVPSIAIDVKALGGMYANNIYLMGTEKGLGVNNAGALQAVNNLVVTSAGKIEHSGTISSTSKTQSLVNISTTNTGAAGDINSSGSINGYGILNIDAGNDININAKDITLNYEGVSSSPLILSAKGNLNLAAGTKVANLGALGDLYIDAKNINLGADTELRSNRGSAVIQANNSLVSNKAGFVAAKDLTLSGNANLKLTDTRLHASTGDIYLQSTSKDNVSNDINVQGGSVYAAKGLTVYSDKDATINNLNFLKKANSTQAQVNSINAYAGNNLNFSTTNQEFPYTSGKIQLGAGNQLTLEGKDQNSKLSGGGGLKLSGKNITTKNIYMTGSGANGVDIISDGGDILLDQGSRIWGNTGDININALNGNITTNSLKATTGGKIAILANKNVELNSLQKTATPVAGKNTLTTDKSVIGGQKGVTIGSIGEGNVKINATNLTAQQGEIQLTSQNGLTLDKNIDVILKNDTLSNGVVSSVLNGQAISIDNNKSNIQIADTQLTATTGKLLVSNKVGMTTIKDSVLTSKGNTELHAKDLLTLQGVTATSDQHLAVNSGRTVYINAEYTPATVWIPNKVTNLTSKGVTSVTATGNQVLQNANITGGAVLMEAGGFILGQTGMNYNATGSDLLKNDTKLNSLNGDLSIQTGRDLTIDPTKHKLSAVGDIDLVSKNGALILTGYGGTKGNSSEKVVSLNTINGGINLQGNKVELRGSQLNADKDISVVSTKGDLFIDGVKNNLSNEKALSQLIKWEKELNSLNKQLDIEAINAKNSPNYKAYNLEIEKANEIFKNAMQNREYLGNQWQGMLSYANKIKVEAELKYPEINGPTNKLKKEIEEVQQEISFYNNNINGYEHQGAHVSTKSGNINLVSSSGVSISGSEIDASKGSVLIEAAGTLANQEYQIQGEYKSDKLNSVKQGKINGSIIIDATQDSYEIGQATNDNYNWRSPLNSTSINGDKGVKIKATGETATDNLILQGVGITSTNGNVDIEAYKNIIFDVAVENSYDKSKKTEKKRKWYGKKKTITTITTAERVGGVSVDIEAKNINIKSKDPKVGEQTGPHRTSIDMYSSQLTANGGKVTILAGGDINLLTADNVSKDTLDISKSSSWAGIKLNKSKYTSTRNIKSELPAVLEASYIGAQADGSIILKGTEFNYLEGAEIKAGETISLQTASKLVEETLNKTSNSVVWQSMQDKGSVNETAQLPSFNGPSTPVFKAAGGLIVQIPVGEKDQNKVQLKDEILKLANQPGNQYLKDFVNRNDVDWQKVILTQKDWDYKSQGLTAAGAAILAIVIAAVSGGAGIGALLGTSGTITNAALLSLTTQASISLVNNGGDITQTLKDLGSKESVKSLAATVVTAGLMSQLGTTLNLKPDSALLTDRLINNFTSSVGSTLVQTAINGGNLEDNLKVALLSGLAGTLQGEMANNIKGLEDVNYIAHKLAHALAGCIAGAIQKQCEAGAIGASIGEVIASFYDREPIGANVAELQKLEKKIETTSKLVSGVVAAYAGYDVNTAANAASIAVQNNSNSEIRLEIENQEAFLEGLSPQERTEWETEFKKADLKLGEFALFLSNFIPAGRNANEAKGIALPLFKAWFQNRKIIQTFSKGGISYRVNLPEHIAKFERFKGTAVSGAHNKLEFEALQQTKNIKVVSTKPTQTKGIYEIEYQVPAYHPQQPGVITGYKRVETKTVYDPKVFTDNQIVDMSQKAAALGYKEAVNLYKSSNGRMNQYESTYNGIKFRSYIAKNDNGQLFISNVHVVK
ncbi:filamentous hemagglutinin family N-terminal domain protein [Acinetobacter baumannii 1437282]|nr:filamentous hemagglutinin family N-terminal domain protein [Acinetobacter baumannii 1437282]